MHHIDVSLTFMWHRLRHGATPLASLPVEQVFALDKWGSSWQSGNSCRWVVGGFEKAEKAIAASRESWQEKTRP